MFRSYLDFRPLLNVCKKEKIFSRFLKQKKQKSKNMKQIVIRNYYSRKPFNNYFSTARRNREMLLAITGPFHFLTKKVSPSTFSLRTIFPLHSLTTTHNLVEPIFPSLFLKYSLSYQPSSCPPLFFPINEVIQDAFCEYTAGIATFGARPLKGPKRE